MSLRGQGSFARSADVPSTACWAKFSLPYAIVGPHAHAKAPEVRFSNRLWLRPIGLEKRTSAAKAVQRQAICGTAEAVPFVKSLFSHLAKALTNAEVVP
jgi:hypothetical protein